MADEFSLGDYLPFLQELSKCGEGYFLEGGQAVNFWAEFFVNQPDGIAPAIADYLPLTSKDCDIWVHWDCFHKLCEDLGDALVKSESPVDGQLGIYTLKSEPRQVVDLMSLVFGIPIANNLRLLERSLEIGGVRSLDPIHLFQSKCACWLDLDQSSRQDEKHVRILALILPAYFTMLHFRALAGEITERQLIKEIKLLRKISNIARVRRATKELGMNPDQLLPLDLLCDSELPLIRNFAASLKGPN